MRVSPKLAELEVAVKELATEEKLELASKLLELLRADAAKKPRVDLSKFRGTVDFGVDGVEYQRRIRDEWDQTS